MAANADTFSTSIAAAVRAEMGRQGKKFKELVAPLGLSYPTVSGRLNGHTPFTAAELDKVARFLGITAYDLIDSAALGGRFSESTKSSEVVRITPPQDDWAQPSRSKRRAS
jgi:transcriptional regulator with XRE-family HTH domain